MAYVVNDRIKLIDGGAAIIKFIGKTRLDNTIWYGIEYLSSLTSPFKPTLITIADIKSHKNKFSKSMKKLKSHKKTSSSILNGTNNYKKKSLKSKKIKSNIYTLDSSYTKTKKQPKSAKKQPKSWRSSSMDIMDINNTFAINDDFDNISSTIDFPENNKKKSPTKNNKKMKIIKKKKRRNKYHSDISGSIMSSPSLKKKNGTNGHKNNNKQMKKLKNTQKQLFPQLSMNGIEHSLNINFDKKSKHKKDKKQKNMQKNDMPSINPMIGHSKSDETEKLFANTSTFDINDQNENEAMSASYSSNIDFAALIDDNIILNEEKEIENDINYKQKYSKIFTSIKSKPLKSKSLQLIELKHSMKKDNVGKRELLTDGIINGEKHVKKTQRNHVHKQLSNKSYANGSGSLKKLKLNRKAFNGKIQIGKRYLLKDETIGICRFYGYIDENENEKYIGIELEFGEGNTNGFINGAQYFKCIMQRNIEDNKRGVFVKKNELQKDLGFDDVLD